ncbi:acyltransferase family protein [Microbacterium sp.]|uniref:acyltransferase family protein n=1 Tax=Microbacterium sp. TaxID=51671 RepID=UPI001AD0E012|nr:acyltransferase family protein [Microbacterium sp.]MBN9193105.1 acetyltransferase [Microbacterium sp.]
MSSPASPSLRPARYAGLDGLRALAVGLVVVYHLFPQWLLRSGFVGVDVFFVISGFLITSLLLREREVTGRIHLVVFWRRRARRLLPALAVMVTVCATWAWLVGGDVLVRLGWQVLGAATFSYNWLSVAGGSGYFSADTPELFRNLWSLAVEEQFYVLWPLLLPLILVLPRAWARAALALVLAAGSAVWMGVVASDGGDPTRAYFGTDTHAFGILLGVALAFVLPRLLIAPPAWLEGRVARAVGLTVGLATVVGLVGVAMLPAGDGIGTFPGVLLAASVLTAVAIVAGVAPRSWFGRAVDVAPLRWIGDRSYAIYLWHWPVLVLLVASAQTGPADATVPVWLGLLTLALTLAAAELSYRFVERPVRRRGFRGSLRELRARLAGTPRSRFGALATLAVALGVVSGTTAAIAAAPARSSGADVVAAGAEALRQASASPAVSPPLAPPTPRPSTSAADPGPVPAPTPSAVGGGQITAVGDSVMLASAPALLERYPGAQIDAKVSRSMYAAPGILRALAAAGQLRTYVVLALGTNGAIDTGSLDQVREIIGPQRTLVLVNAYAPRSWIPGVNRTISDYAAQHPGVVVADWSDAIAPHVGLLAGDHIHPGMAGGRIFAASVGDAIAAAEEAKARAQYLMALRAYRLAHPYLPEPH